MYEHLQNSSFLVMYVVFNKSKYERKYGAPKLVYRQKKNKIEGKTYSSVLFLRSSTQTIVQ